MPVNGNMVKCKVKNFLEVVDEFSLLNSSGVFYSIEPNWHVISNGYDTIDIVDGMRPSEMVTAFIIHDSYDNPNFIFDLNKYFFSKGIKMIVGKSFESGNYLVILVTNKSENEILELLRNSKIDIAHQPQDIKVHKFTQIRLEEYLNPIRI